MASYKYRCSVVGHGSDVRAVTATVFPEGGILSGSRDRTARIWVPNTSESGFHEAHEMSGHENFVACVCIMPPDDKYPQGLILTGSNDSSIRGFTLDSPAAVFKLEGHSNTVSALAAGKFGTMLSGSWDQTAKVWLNAKCVMTLQGHEAAVWAVAIIPEQGLMLTGSADKTIKLWKAGKCERTFTGHDDCVRGLTVVQGGEFLSCSNDATIRRWLTTGECLFVYYGHENFVYSLSLLPNGQDFISSGEDRTVKVWRGGECVQTIPHPSISVWTVCALPNGDIVSGSSDGNIRVFSTDPSRVASLEDQKAFEDEVATSTVPTQVGDIKTEDLPGPEALLNPGNKDGQTKMVKTEDKVELYHWDAGEAQWKKIGDVVGSAGGTQETSGKALYEGKEYEYVFTVDIQEGKPPLKLPYNSTEDPYFAAQKFLDKNNLSQLFLDQVANFIMENTKGVTLGQSAGYSDPFTGGARYVPGSGSSQHGQGVGGSDPFTGAGRYVPGSAAGPTPVAPSGAGADPFTGSTSYRPSGGAGDSGANNSYFPQTKYISFDAVNQDQVIGKLKEFNQSVDPAQRVEEAAIERMRALMSGQLASSEQLNTLEKLLTWPPNVIFPALDILRISVKFPSANQHFCTADRTLQNLLSYWSTDSSTANQMLTMRTVCNMFSQSNGEKLIIRNRDQVIATSLNCMGVDNKNVQIAVASVLLNCAVSLHTQPDLEAKSQCMSAVATVLEAMSDVEAMYRLLICTGTLLWKDAESKLLGQSLGLEACVVKLLTSDSKKVAESAKHVLEQLR